MKKIVMTALCFLVSLFLFTGTAKAAGLKSSYELKKGNHFDSERVEIKGGQTKTITLKVKDNATFKLASKNYFYDNVQLRGNEEIKIKVVNAKGKTLTTKYVKKSGRVYYSTNLKKGTYRIVISTKNVKKNAKRAYNIGFTLNDSPVLKVGGNKVYDIVNNENTTKIKFINNKTQAVKIKFDGAEMESAVLNVTDAKGKLVYKDWVNADDAWDLHYLPKGTYYISLKEDISVLQSFYVSVSNTYSNNVIGNADSKEKAVNYTEKRINFAYTNIAVKKKTQWLKVDTAKNDFAFDVDDTIGRSGDAPGALAGVKVYKENGTEVEVDGYMGYSFPKGSGIYYVSIPINSSEIATVNPRAVAGAVVADDKRTVVTNYTEFTTKSDAKKEVSGKLYLTAESYVGLTTYEYTMTSSKENGLELYTKDNKKIAVDKDGFGKLQPGEYTFKGTAIKANASANCRIVTYRVKDFKANKIEYVAKKKTVSLSGIKADKIYCFNVFGLGNSGANSTIVIYEDGKKIAEGKNAVYFNTKSKKAYSAVITTKDNQLIQYSYSAVETLKDRTSDFKSTKKAAKTYTVNEKAKISKGIRVLGKYTGWMKVKNTSKKKAYLTISGYMNQSPVYVKIYNAKGTLKKTLKVDTNKSYAWYELAANQSYSVKVYSTDKNASSDLSVEVQI